MESCQRIREIGDHYQTQLTLLEQWLAWKLQVTWPFKDSQGNTNTKGPAYQPSFPEYVEAVRMGQVKEVDHTLSGLQHKSWYPDFPKPKTLYWKFIHYHPHGILPINS